MQLKMLDWLLSKLKNKKIEVVETEVASDKQEQPKQMTQEDIDKKLDEVLELAGNYGCINLTRDHIKPVLTLPGVFEKENEKNLILLLRHIDLKVKLVWEEQVDAYLRIPMCSMPWNSGNSNPPWG